jgi:hypothetical protein
MDQRDQELLDRQVRRLAPSSHNDGAILLAVLAVFLAGMTLGGFLVDKTESVQVAANDTAPALSLPHGASPMTPQ